MANSPYANIQWKAVDCDSNHLDIPDIGDTVLWESKLFISSFDRIRIYDVSEPLNIKYLSAIGVDWPGRIKILDGVLYVYCEKRIEVVDFSDLKALTKTTLVDFARTQYGGTLAKSNEILYITHKNEVCAINEAGAVTSIFSLESIDPFFGSYPSDMFCIKDHLYIVGRHSGLAVVDISVPGSAKLVKLINKGFTPTDIQYNDPMQCFFMVGNEDFIQVDAGDVSKPRRHKSVKFSDIELAGQFGYLNKEHVVLAGFSVKSNKTMIGTIQLRKDGSPLLVNKQTGVDHKSPIEEKDVMKACYFIKDYLLLISYKKKLQVYRIER